MPTFKPLVETTQGNRCINLMPSENRTTTSFVDVENPLNRGGSFIINVTGAGNLQSETATVAGTITVSGSIDVIVTGALIEGTPLTIPVAVLAGDTPNVLATKIKTALNISAVTDAYTISGATNKVVLTTNEPADTDATLNIDVHYTLLEGLTNDTSSDNTEAGAVAYQIETATVVGTITNSDNIVVIVTGASVAGSPLSLNVAVEINDTANDIAGKIRTALDIPVITTNYTVGGADDAVILTTKNYVSNDSSLNIDVHYTPLAGLTDDETSADTQAGVATTQIETATVVGTITTSGNVEIIVTGALIQGTPLTIPVAVLANDTPSDVAGKIRTALDIPAITTNYTVGGATDKVILTAKIPATDDVTLNMNIHNLTSEGLDDDVFSANTQAGVATLQIETATLVGTITASGIAEVIVTGDLVTGSPLSFIVGLLKDDTPALVAEKIRTALNIPAITDNYTIGGATDKVILTTKAIADDDTSLNIDIHSIATIGLVDDTSSANSQAGVATAQIETATLVGTVTTKGQSTVIVTGALVTGSPLSIYVNFLVNDTADIMAGKIRTALNIPAITTNYTVSGATDKVILTAKTASTNDTTLNIDVHITTSNGLTNATTSADTYAGEADISIIPKIQGIDSVNKVYYDILTGAEITAEGTFILKVYPNLTPVTNLVVNDILPANFRFVMTHGDTVNAIYSVVFNSNT